MPSSTATKLTLAEAKRRLAPGTVWDVTNHYISRPDHECYGTRRRTIQAAGSTGFVLSLESRPDGSRVRWPKAAQIAADGNAILIYGGGVSQEPADLFLTLRPAS